MNSFQKTASIRGAICGKLWWPVDAPAGIRLSTDLRAKFHRFATPDKGEHVSFRDALLSILNENGGDFQGALFADGTEIILERREWSGIPGHQRGRTVIKGIPVASLPDCADLVRKEVHCDDFTF